MFERGRIGHLEDYIVRIPEPGRSRRRKRYKHPADIRGFPGKDICERTKLTKDIERIVTKKFIIPFDITTLTPDKFENGTSTVA